MPIPTLTISQMREWEQATWTSGQTEAEVIRRVGACLAQHALRLTRANELVLLLAGRGHNGDDARAAREHLAGRRVELLEVNDPAEALPKLAAHLRSEPSLLIDGLFGIGLNRPLSPEWVQFIEAVNKSNVPVLAVDVPSGLNADTGGNYGAAIRAAETLTVGAPKMGMLQAQAVESVGRLEVAADVGLVPCQAQSELQWTVPADFRGFPPARSVGTHKGTYGHLAIVAGSLGYHGAAVLAARGAQRAQPGLITVYTMEPVYPLVGSQLQAVMVSPWMPDAKLPGNPSAVLIGPGLAAPDVPEQLRAMARNLWRNYTLPVIADASALDWLPLEDFRRTAVRVITPHPGEAGRLLRSNAEQVQANRFHAVREISRRFGHTWLVLKGHQTIVGCAEGPLFVNSSGNPYLAQGGSGDVLGGFIAGLLAQPQVQRDISMALRYAVWEHGAAADRLQARRPGWVVEELVEEIRERPPGLATGATHL